MIVVTARAREQSRGQLARRWGPLYAAVMVALLAVAADFRSPLFWAAFIGWEMSVILHEFAHGLVAHFGGDYTIRERGGLTLNPFQYIDPMVSLVLPLVFFMLGGVPLPGGVTYVRRDLLRGTFWQVAVSAAGPATNLLLFFGLAVALHPRLGWVDPELAVIDWSSGQKVAGALAFLQLYAVLLNLIPIPPLDGFQMLSPFLPADLRNRLMQPSNAIIGFLVLGIIASNHRFMMFAYDVMRPVVRATGNSFADWVTAARLVLYGAT